MIAVAEAASEDCVGCYGTGVIYGTRGSICPCVARCEDCEAVFNWDHDDERPPRLCGHCEGQETHQ